MGSEFRALVVDDDPTVRRLTLRALKCEGFASDEASDGEEALAILQGQPYHLVVTDLRMPRYNGHALAVRLLQQPNRPCVAVLTAVTEPRLVRDLIARGVDDLTFKPVDLLAYAAKLRALMTRFVLKRPGPLDAALEALGEASGKAGAARSSREPAPFDISPVEAAELERGLAQCFQALPVSTSALEVHRLASSEGCTARQVAAAIQPDPALVAEILRAANNAVFHPNAKRVTDLEEAVVRIGLKRTQELALATSALTAVTEKALPWMDLKVLSRQSVAAGIALECLVEQGRHHALEQGLLAGAIMHGLGRVCLASLFRRHYEKMLARFQAHGEALVLQESQVFGESHASIAARLLASWDAPADICEPLRYFCHSYASLEPLSEPLRTKVELIKLAVLAGQAAVGAWEPWDWIELPPAATLARLKVSLTGEIIAKVRAASPDASPLGNRRAANDPPFHALYCNLTDSSIDPLAELMQSLGLQFRSHSADAVPKEERVIVNGLQAPADALAARLASARRRNLTIFCDPQSLDEYATWGAVAAIPGPAGPILEALQAAARPAQGA